MKKFRLWLWKFFRIGSEAESIHRDLKEARQRRRRDDALKFLPWILPAILLAPSAVGAAGHAILMGRAGGRPIIDPDKIEDGARKRNLWRDF